MVVITLTLEDAAEEVVLRHLSAAAAEIGSPIKLRYEEPAAAAPEKEASSRVTYELTERAAQLDGVKETLRLFILAHPRSTAKAIEEGTGQGRKSVESAIHALRRMGVIRSVQA